MTIKGFFTIAAALCIGLCAQARTPEVFQEDTTNFWAIDMTILTVEGRHYAVWSGWDRYYYMAEAPMQNMYIAPMIFHDEKPYVRLGKRALLTSPQLPFETKVNEHISLVEGPTGEVQHSVFSAFRRESGSPLGAGGPMCR